jgi:hypothetical protein
MNHSNVYLPFMNLVYRELAGCSAVTGQGRNWRQLPLSSSYNLTHFSKFRYQAMLHTNPHSYHWNQPIGLVIIPSSDSQDGGSVNQSVDFNQRLSKSRLPTCMHLLSVLIPCSEYYGELSVKPHNAIMLFILLSLPATLDSRKAILNYSGPT